MAGQIRHMFLVILTSERQAFGAVLQKLATYVPLLAVASLYVCGFAERVQR